MGWTKSNTVYILFKKPTSVKLNSILIVVPTEDRMNFPLNTDIVLRCILIIEEYFPEIDCIQAKKNIVADELLRLPNEGNKKARSNMTCSRDGHLLINSYPYI